MGLTTVVDIIGYWAQHVIFYSHTEEESIAFLPDGTGYLFWHNLFCETIDVFRWSLSNGKINIVGLKQLVFKEDELHDVRPSDLKIQEMRFELVKRESISGEVVDALEFSDSLRMFSDSRYGLVSREVNDIENYRNIKEILSRDGDDQ